jgi:glycosyltransferase involved in cell wall biosynthesis
MLTVVLANYNHASFLPFALEGLVRQTRSADEIIVIDDASTDGSVGVIETYLRKHPNMRLVRNPDNRGIVRNMNAGLAMAKGRYVYFAAADDVTYPMLFETALGLFEKHPQAAIFSARSDLIDAGGRNRGLFATPVPRSSPGFIAPEEAARHLLKDDSWFMGNTAIYRAEHTRSAGGFPEELAAFTDGYVSRLLAVKHGACFSPAVLAAWRRMEGGMAWSHTVDIESARTLIGIAERRMVSDGVFPPGYVERWKRRYLFAALRFRLTQQRKQAGGGQFVGLVREWLLTAWWFVTLRHWDIYPVLRRRLAGLLRPAER